MGRGKLPLKLIPKERARRITFAKRKTGLLKKAYELSTLCDVKVCVLVYDPTNQPSDDHHHDGRHNHDHHHRDQRQPGLETWPKHRDEVESIIAKYLAYKAKNPVSKKDLDLTDFFKEKIRRLQHETKKLAQENDKIMMLKQPDHHHHHHHQFDLWDHRIDGFSLTQLQDLMIHLDNRISYANKHWMDRCNNMMLMCVTPHDNKSYHDDHHNYHHAGNSNQASDYQYDNHDYHNNNQLVFSPYDHHCYNQVQYSWHHHDQPSSSKTLPFDHNHMVGTTSVMNNAPYGNSDGSFTSMMLNNHEIDYDGDDGRFYSGLMNIGSAMFNNSDNFSSGTMFNNNINSSSGVVTSAMTADHDHHVHHHQQHGVFFDNHADMALQPYVRSFADGSLYSPATGLVYEQYSPVNQFRPNSSQQDAKFLDSHGFGKVPAVRLSVTMD